MPKLKPTAIVTLRLVSDYGPWSAGEVVQVDEVRGALMLEAGVALLGADEDVGTAPDRPAEAVNGSKGDVLPPRRGRRRL